MFVPCVCQTNQPEPARKDVLDDKVTHTNLYEGHCMIFQPLLSHFRLLQSFRDGKEVPYFLVFIAVFPPCFCQTNRPEPARKVIQNDKVSHTNL